MSGLFGVDELFKPPYRVGPHKGSLALFCDGQGRHLVCQPYSLNNLHLMALMLGIKRCWFHAGRLAHYDIPKTRIAEISARCAVVDSRRILEIIKGEP